jgi:hypothetical protein
MPMPFKFPKLPKVPKLVRPPKFHAPEFPGVRSKAKPRVEAEVPGVRSKAKTHVGAEAHPQKNLNAGGDVHTKRKKMQEVHAELKPKSQIARKSNLKPSENVHGATKAGKRAKNGASSQELAELKSERGGDMTQPGKMQKTKKFVMKHAGKIFGGLGIAIVAGVAIAGAVNKQKCFRAWQETYKDFWEGDSGMRDTKDKLKSEIKGRGATDSPSDARVDEAYAALAKCDDEDILAHFIAGVVETVVVPVAKGAGEVVGTVTGDVLGPVLEPIGKALKSFVPVFVVLACIVALGVAYKIYTMFQDGRGSDTIVVQGGGVPEPVVETGFGRSRLNSKHGRIPAFQWTRASAQRLAR